jgi:hypothetical protein
MRRVIVVLVAGVALLVGCRQQPAPGPGVRQVQHVEVSSGHYVISKADSAAMTGSYMWCRFNRNTPQEVKDCTIWMLKGGYRFSTPEIYGFHVSALDNYPNGYEDMTAAMGQLSLVTGGCLQLLNLGVAGSWYLKDPVYTSGSGCY